jgi:hypothetical protein
MNELGYLHYVCGLWSLWAVFDCEFNLVAFRQGLEAIRLNRGKVDKHVFAAIARDKAIALGIVEPLDRTLDTILHADLHPPLIKNLEKNPVDQNSNRQGRQVPALAISTLSTPNAQTTRFFCLHYHTNPGECQGFFG